MAKRKFDIEAVGSARLETPEHYAWFRAFRFGNEPQSVKPCFWSINFDETDKSKATTTCYRVLLKTMKLMKKQGD